MRQVRPRVSVLLPACNAAATLSAALASVRRQTEQRWECVIVDDGSSDGTLGLAREAEARDPRFRVLSLPHGGIVAALQRGLEQCQGELIARMDADDLMQRRRLERQIGALEREPELAAVGCHVRLFPRAAMTDGLRDYEAWLNAICGADELRREAFVECPLAHPTLMVRRRTLLAHGYRECPWPEDYDLVLRLLEAGERLNVVPERLLHWRDGAARLSRSSPRYAQAAFVECKAEYLARGFLRARQSYLLWGFGDTGKALARALARRDKHPAAIIELHPGRLGQWIRNVRVVPPEALRTLPREPLVVSVAGLTARSEIRAALLEMGMKELDDFVCAA